jgi:hypothetical protein
MGKQPFSTVKALHQTKVSQNEKFNHDFLNSYCPSKLGSSAEARYNLPTLPRDVLLLDLREQIMKLEP